MSPPAFSPELCRVSAAKLASPKPKHHLRGRATAIHLDVRQISTAEKQLRCLALGEAAFGKRGADEEEDKPGDEEDLVALAKPGLFLVLLHKRNLA